MSFDIRSIRVKLFYVENNYFNSRLVCFFGQLN